MKKGIDSRISFVFAMLIFGSVGIFVKSITLSSGVITLSRGVSKVTAFYPFYQFVDFFDFYTSLIM